MVSKRQQQLEKASWGGVSRIGFERDDNDDDRAGASSSSSSLFVLRDKYCSRGAQIGMASIYVLNVFSVLSFDAAKLSSSSGSLFALSRLKKKKKKSPRAAAAFERRGGGEEEKEEEEEKRRG